MFYLTALRAIRRSQVWFECGQAPFRFDPLSSIPIYADDMQLSRLIVARENPTTFIHAARTAVAAIASYLLANIFRLPEPY